MIEQNCVFHSYQILIICFLFTHLIGTSLFFTFTISFEHSKDITLIASVVSPAMCGVTIILSKPHKE